MHKAYRDRCGVSDGNLRRGGPLRRRCGPPCGKDEVRTVKQKQEAAQTEFEAELAAYREAPRLPSTSSTLSEEQWRHLNNIAKLGPHVLPALMEEVRRSRHDRLGVPLMLITGVRFLYAEWPGTDWKGSYDWLDLFIEWWEGGQELTDELFARNYATGNMMKVAALGWGAMPRIVEKLQEGDEDLMKAVRQIALVEVRLKRIPSEAVEDSESWIAWWEKNKGDWAIPFPDLQKEKDKEADGETAIEQEEAPQAPAS